MQSNVVRDVTKQSTVQLQQFVTELLTANGLDTKAWGIAPDLTHFELINKPAPEPIEDRTACGSPGELMEGDRLARGPKGTVRGALLSLRRDDEAS